MVKVTRLKLLMNRPTDKFQRVHFADDKKFDEVKYDKREVAVYFSVIGYTILHILIMDSGKYTPFFFFFSFGFSA